MTDEEIRKDIETKLTVPLWPHAGRALGLARNSTYSAAVKGEIATIQVGKRKPVPTSWLRRKLQMEGA